MDIVDTFNHLIPTEHLDDALFLGGNMESEVCDEFSASHNVLEDSLKNMLSDKDPMLGSASSQFCLSALDSSDIDFPVPCTTELDDVMNESDVKESGHDTMEEEELLLPGRNLRRRTAKSSTPSPRKSPRIVSQEPRRSLRQSTIARRSDTSASVTKNSPVKSTLIQNEQTPPEKQLALSPEGEEQGEALQESEKNSTLRRSTRRGPQTAQEMPVQASTPKKRVMRSTKKKGLNEMAGDDTVVSPVKKEKPSELSDSLVSADHCLVKNVYIGDKKDTADIETECTTDKPVSATEFECTESDDVELKTKTVENVLQSSEPHSCTLNVMLLKPEEKSLETLNISCEVTKCTDPVKVNEGNEQGAPLIGEHPECHSNSVPHDDDNDGRKEFLNESTADSSDNLKPTFGNVQLPAVYEGGSLSEDLQAEGTEACSGKSEDNLVSSVSDCKEDQKICDRNDKQLLEHDAGSQLADVKHGPKTSKSTKRKETKQQKLLEKNKITPGVKKIVPRKRTVVQRINVSGGSQSVMSPSENPQKGIKRKHVQNKGQTACSPPKTPKKAVIAKRKCSELESLHHGVSSEVQKTYLGPSVKVVVQGTKVRTILTESHSPQIKGALVREHGQKVKTLQAQHNPRIKKTLATDEISQVKRTLGGDYSLHGKILLSGDHGPQVRKMLVGDRIPQVRPAQKKQRLQNKLIKAKEYGQVSASKKPVVPSLGQNQLQKHQDSKQILSLVKRALPQSKPLQYSSLKHLQLLLKHTSQHHDNDEEKLNETAKDLKEEDREKFRQKKTEKGTQPRKRRSSTNYSSVINQQHEIVEEKDTMVTEDLKEEDKEKLGQKKLEKGIQPRQRRSSTKNLSLVSQQQEDVEEKEKEMTEDLKDEDREKLRQKRLEKGIQPRQRRSSTKSLSLDDTPLFIPDNIPSKGSEVHPYSDKGLWDHNKHCSFCRKPRISRFMVGCGRCDEWFHGDCVGLSLAQAQYMEQEDMEYVCSKCSAEERKARSVDHSVQDHHSKHQRHGEKAVEKPRVSSPVGGTGVKTGTNEKTKHVDSAAKHKVKIFKKEPSDGKSLVDLKDLEGKKYQQLHERKAVQPVSVLHRSPEQKSVQPPPMLHRSPEENTEKLSRDISPVSSPVEKALKTGTVAEKQEVKKKKIEKGSPGTAQSPPANKPSIDQIRQSVRQSLKETLEKRIAETNMSLPEDRPGKVAGKIEKELFTFFRDTDLKYKNKYRSLSFNLKDPKNKVLFKRVLRGEITAEHLIRMSPEELASKELADWRQRENRHTIEMIEKEQREVERRPITKITHKGEIEIETDAQEKEQETPEVEEPDPKIVEKVEKVEEVEVEKKVEITKDTTNQHKTHLFDLNCKICTGRMAPPADELCLKKVKVASGVVRKPSDNDAENFEESLAEALSVANQLVMESAEEEEEEEEVTPDSPVRTPPSPESSQSSIERFERPGTAEDEATFLARLDLIWKGFIHMSSVAKFVSKAFPVSGSLEHLKEDLPDAVHVGGRISPQTVWDYVEKIRASGTKEICVVRFCPATEEDQIAYTLLYAYFNSRKRYGVVANNMKQVKDMYLIPLGASEKVSHHLVPFDGPGLEMHRPNLLLGLIIRQRSKRQLSTGLTDEIQEEIFSSLASEKRSKKEDFKEELLDIDDGDDTDTDDNDNDENDFFNSVKTVLPKHRNKIQELEPDGSESTDSVGTDTPKRSRIEPAKPLRFLPGVLVGWEGQPFSIDLASKPLPDDILQGLFDNNSTDSIPEHLPDKESETGSQKTLPDDEIGLKEKNAASSEELNTETVQTKCTLGNSQKSSSVTYKAEVEMPSAVEGSGSAGGLAGLSLKDKPPDVSTEAFLASISSLQTETETKNSLEEIEPKDKPAVASVTVLSCSVKTDEKSSDTVAVENTSPKPSRYLHIIKRKRDPRQAAVRSQKGSILDTAHEKVSCGEQDDKQSEENQSQKVEQHMVSEGEQVVVDHKHISEEKSHNFSQRDEDKFSPDTPQKQTTQTLQVSDMDSSPGSLHHESGNFTELISKDTSCSPNSDVNFSAVRSSQHSFHAHKNHPMGHQFQGSFPPNFPPHNLPVLGFPPRLPPPPPPPPPVPPPVPSGFGYPRGPSMGVRHFDPVAPNHMVPWPPLVQMPGHPVPFSGPMELDYPRGPEESRFVDPHRFHPNKGGNLLERHNSGPWERYDQPHTDREFYRERGGHNRPKYHSDLHYQRKERDHELNWNSEKVREKSWDHDSERERHRQRERRSRDEMARDRSSGEKVSEGKHSRDERSSERHGSKSRSEEHHHDRERESEKSRDKHRHRDRDKDRERDKHSRTEDHDRRDHSERSKSKR
ncbi:PHD finger protein 3 [Protopterus annectens]|uniref:PHD finger protein 3 n=1 Tax=Protopterus annectens TaxID=7888 RepID=UPI001CFA0473|nr:PHD finger protein 3 [Protopterus annectens]XP_043919790.1 PHD finger protein 3 [Protopterus annectens]XP_043919791.1 PHD finger protein 3 [Protopterus annectens]